MLEGEIGPGRGDQIMEAAAGRTGCPPQAKLSAHMARRVGWAILSCGNRVDVLPITSPASKAQGKR